MFIQEIIIDGFKSYAHRTVVQGYVYSRWHCYVLFNRLAA